MIGKRLVNTGGAVAAFDALQNFEVVTYTGNGGTQKITGYIRKGAAFNGSSSKINLGNPIGVSDSFTISMWIYATSGGILYGRGIVGTGNEYGFGISYNTSTGSFYLTRNVGTSTLYYVQSANNVASAGQWNHIAATFDISGGGSNGIATIYANGSQVGQQTNWSTSPISYNGSYDSGVQVLGERGAGGFLPSYFGGRIDQVRIFNTALNSTQVGELALEEYGDAKNSVTDFFGNGSGVALYQLDEDANNTGSYPYGQGDIDSGQSAVFNGSSSYISTGINFSTLPNTKSISMWVKSSGSSSIGFGGMNGSSANNGLFAFDELAGNVAYIPKFGGYHTGDASTVVTNAWNHFVVTDTNVDGNVKMYINGSEVTVTKINSTVYVNNTNMQIGRQMRNNGTTAWQTGSIDQVRIYSSVLSGSDVEALVSETNVPTANLVAHYKLNGNANDETGTYNGTASNVTYSDPAEFPLIAAYNGTPTNVNFLGMAFQPDLVWIKKRSGTAALASHILHDSVRGATYSLYSDLTNAEGNTNAISSFDSNGFTIGTSYDGTNGSGNDIVAWCWKAADTTTTISAGTVGNTIASDVRANQAAGFSIVTWTGDGNDATVAHGLSSQPELVITKGRANLATYNNWTTYHKDLSTNHHLYLNTTDGEQNGIGDYFRDAAFSNTVIGLGNDIYGPNVNGTTMVAYCFHSVDFYQKVGSYSGNSSVAITVTTGFKPRFLMIKQAVGTSSAYTGWVMFDYTRDIDSDQDNPLYANANYQEGLRGNGTGSADDSVKVQFTDTGFIVDPDLNRDGETNAGNNTTYIYLAIA